MYEYFMYNFAFTFYKYTIRNNNNKYKKKNCRHIKWYQSNVSCEICEMCSLFTNSYYSRWQTLGGIMN